MSYTVWNPANGQTKEDGRVIETYNAYSAAEIWAQREDAEGADYLIVRGEDATVLVSKNGAEPIEVIVSGESVPEYRARLVVKKESPNA